MQAKSFGNLKDIAIVCVKILSIYVFRVFNYSFLLKPLTNLNFNCVQANCAACLGSPKFGRTEKQEERNKSLKWHKK